MNTMLHIIRVDANLQICTATLVQMLRAAEAATRMRTAAKQDVSGWEPCVRNFPVWCRCGPRGMTPGWVAPPWRTPRWTQSVRVPQPASRSRAVRPPLRRAPSHQVNNESHATLFRSLAAHTGQIPGQRPAFARPTCALPSMRTLTLPPLHTLTAATRFLLSDACEDGFTLAAVDCSAPPHQLPVP